MRIFEVIGQFFRKRDYSSPPPPPEDDAAVQMHQAQMSRLRAATRARRAINEKILEVEDVLKVAK